MTTYREYLATHPHIQMDERILDRDITPDALAILELYKHLDAEVKDYYQYEDKMNAVVDVYDDNNVSIIASTTGGTTPIECSGVVGDKNRFNFDYVMLSRRDSMGNLRCPGTTLDMLIDDVNDDALETIKMDRENTSIYRKPSTEQTLLETDGSPYTRFDQVVLLERARHMIERKIENAGFKIDGSYVDVDLYQDATTRVYAEMPDGRTSSRFEVYHDLYDATVQAFRKDVTEYDVETDVGRVMYEVSHEHHLATLDAKNFDTCLVQLDEFIVVEEQREDTVLSDVTSDFAKFNPLTDIPHVDEALNSKFARVTVSEATLEDAPSGVYVNYFWNDEDGDVAAAVYFARHDTEGAWFFDGNVDIGNDEIDKHTSGSLEDVRAQFKAFCDEFSTKVNAVYTSSIVQELDDDNLEL